MTRWRTVVVLPLLLGACAVPVGRPPQAEPVGPPHPTSGTATVTPPPRGASDRTERRASATAYSGSVHPIGSRLRDRLPYSRHPGCPVPLTDLRYLQMTYLGFDGVPHTGEMVVHRKYADAVVEVFQRLYAARWPIRGMRLVDNYHGDDDASMAANNTSGYNCRRVAGSTAWSAHAYGTAIDINPVQNPYLAGSAIHPPAAARFATIPRTPGTRVPVGAIRAGDLVVRAFARIGWAWGGDWPRSKDYQHFYAAGG